MKVKIAAYKYTEGPLAGMIAVRDYDCDEFENYIRVSEWAEFDLPDLPAGDVLECELAAIDAIEAETKAKFHDAMVAIETRRQELRALPEPVTA